MPLKKYRKSFVTSIKILEVMSTKGEVSQSDLPREVKKDYRTTLRHVHQLRKYGLIELARTERSKKKGKERNIFRLTPLGLFEVLRYKAKFDFQQLGTKNPTLLPLIFGKYQLWAKHGFLKVITESLYEYAKEYHWRTPILEFTDVSKEHPDSLRLLSLQSQYLKRVEQDPEWEVSKDNPALRHLHHRITLSEFREAQNGIIDWASDVARNDMTGDTLYRFILTVELAQAKRLIQADSEIKAFITKYVDNQLDTMKKRVKGMQELKKYLK